MKATTCPGEHCSETARIVANNVCAAEEWVFAAYGKDLYSDFGLDLSEDGIAAVEVQKGFLLRLGFIERDFDIGRWMWIMPEPLEMALCGN